MKALITGITGQDGSYLAELLLEKNYEVHAIQRRSSVDNCERIKDLEIKTHYGDLTDSGSIMRTMQEVKPDEVYNLAAQSDVGISFQLPEYTADVDGLGPLRLLEAIRTVSPTTKFYQASTSEIFGEVTESPQTEETPFKPRSPYGVAKLFSYWITVNYREAYNMFACNGILFNHESPRRGDNFVTQKVVKQAIEIKKGQRSFIELGNLDSRRDWGHAKDYVEGMWRMLQQDKPDDYVLATNKSYTVKELVEEVFDNLNMQIHWMGEGEDQVGINYGQVIVKVNPKYYRPAEVNSLQGNANKAIQQLNWKPQYNFKGLVREMVIEASKNSS